MREKASTKNSIYPQARGDRASVRKSRLNWGRASAIQLKRKLAGAGNVSNVVLRVVPNVVDRIYA